ncbi:MAG: thiosulfate oxidation carrier protein SoxY [Lentilitoribacter sp.]
MDLTRRETLFSGSAMLMALGMPARASAQQITAEEVIEAFAGDRKILAGGMTLTLEAVAEDGFKVSIEVLAPGSVAILIIAPQNPVPPVALMKFGPLADRQRFATRIRLARTQEVMALAMMPDGQVRKVTQHVDVIVGGCGA